jgi:energy-coupling factor transporter ATP-binding protein EcfA2
MTDPFKQQSSPFSTGGGGPNFETRIQAAFTVLMITGRVSPCLPAWPITKIKLQGRFAGFNTDDFIVFVNEPLSNKEAKLLAQIKHDVAITSGNATFAEVIGAAWRDFNDASVFDASTDSIALITGPLSSADINNVRVILEWARHSEHETEFLQKVAEPQFSSDAKQQKLQAFKAQLSNANNGVDVSPKQLWEFLKAFHLLGYDLDTESGSTLSLLLSLMAQFSSENPSMLWSRIIDAVQVANQNAGTITLDNLPIDLRNKFRTNTSQPWDTDLKKLREHGEYIIAGINKTVGGVHVNRPKIFAQLLNACEEAKFVLVSGVRGCGKSSLVREFADSMKGESPIFCLRAEDLDKAHLGNVFSEIGLVSSIGDVEAGFALIPKKYLLIESIEKLLELKHTAAFTDLLRFLNKHQGWTVVATGRDYAFQQLVFNYLQPSGVTASTVVVNGFDEPEIRSLCEKLTSLKAIAGNQSLKPLLKNPFLADLAYRVIETGTQFSGSDGEKEFREAVWRDVIAKEHVRIAGMPLKRRKAFVELSVTRAKQMVYGVPESDFDSEVLLELEADSLIRRDIANGLISPAHDVLEDWALERHIDGAYRNFTDDVNRFLSEVGTEPAMNRAFRLWLHQKMKFGDNVGGLVLGILNNQNIERHWQDEAITAVLLGQQPEEFLEALKEDLFDKEGQLLKRFCFMLRISCTAPNQNLIKQLSVKDKKAQGKLDMLFLMPYGHGWQAIIHFLFENKERIPKSLLPHVTAVLQEWSSSLHVEENLPPIARESGLLALHLLGWVKDSYRDDDEKTRKKILEVIIKTASAIENEFNGLLAEDIYKTRDKQRRPSYVEDFCKVVLEDIQTAYLCKQVPETVTKIAFNEWLVDATESKAFWREGWHIGVELYFGVRPDNTDLFPPSGAKGPFRPLFRFHPRKALEFILQLLNRTAEQYANSNLDSPDRYLDERTSAKSVSAEQLEIELEDGTTIRQYYSGRIWAAYRGHSVVPYVLQSALMALENWLVELVEYPESQSTLDWVFDYVLRNSNSVMPTAVLASVATGFPDKLGKAALPLLRTPELYDLDLARKVHERGGNEINWFASTYDVYAEMYAEERRTAALRRWRQEDLESLIVRLQFSDLQKEAFATIDKLRSKAGESESWRFRFHRIDSRGWKPIVDEEKNQITFQPQNLEADLEKIQKESQEKMALMGRFSKLRLWAEKIIKREPMDKDYYPSWLDALKEAKKLLQTRRAEQANDINERVEMHLGGIVKTAAACLRDHLDEMSDEDISWCSEIVINRVLFNSNSIQGAIKVTKVDFDGASASAYVIPILLRFAEGEDILFVKTVIAIGLTHPNADVRAAMAEGIRDYLWQIDSEFAQKCIWGVVKYGRLEEEFFSQRRRSFPFSEEDEQAEDIRRQNWLEEQRQKLANGELSLEAGEIETLNFRTYRAWHLVNACLMIPDQYSNPIYNTLLSQVLTLFFETEESMHKPRRERDLGFGIQIHYELRHPFAERLAMLLLALPDNEGRAFIEQLRQGCNTAPEFIDYLLLQIAVLAERSSKKVRYWELLEKLVPEIQTAAIELAPRNTSNRRNDSRTKLIRGILRADYQWEKTDLAYESTQIEREPAANRRATKINVCNGLGLSGDLP